MLILDYFQRLEHELDFVASQQSELEEILRPLEEPLAGAPPPDAERERIYSLAETLDAQLQRMSDDLREVIDHINSANKSQDESEPLVQISRVLNAHMVKTIEEFTSDPFLFLIGKSNKVTKLKFLGPEIVDHFVL
jgi:hypothetical protein